MNGNNALMGIQQTHKELTSNLWNMCLNLKLILSPIKIIDRDNKN